MNLNEAIDQVLSNNTKIIDDIKTNPKAMFSLVGPIRKLIPNIDPKNIKDALETKFNTKIPDKQKTEKLEIKQDIWIDKHTKDRIIRQNFTTDENMTKIRALEFYYVEGYSNQAYVTDGKSFLEKFEKDTSETPFKQYKWINKETKEEIDCIEKYNNHYLYKNKYSMKILKMEFIEFLNKFERIEYA